MRASFILFRCPAFVGAVFMRFAISFSYLFCMRSLALSHVSPGCICRTMSMMRSLYERVRWLNGNSFALRISRA